MNIDLDDLIRRWKPNKRVRQLRPRAELPQQEPSASLVFDTTVYIHEAGGLLPVSVALLLKEKLPWHCSVCLGELATGVANYSPAASDWHAVKRTYAQIFAAIPAKRLLTPDAETWLSAGMVAGILARTQGFQPHQRKEMMNDALLFLTAAKAGLPVLTANRDQFDLIQQVVGVGGFIPYEAGRGG